MTTTPEATPPQPALAEREEAQLVTLWTKVEDVAMHFNELILNFRLKALGAVTVGAGLFGTTLLTKDNAGAPPVNYFIFAGAMVFLAVVWSAIAAVDLCYYIPLLRGAVREAIRLEAISGQRIRLSHSIEEAVGGRRFIEGKRGSVAIGAATWLFYVLPLAAFLAGAGGALWLAPAAAPAVSSPAAVTPSQRTPPAPSIRPGNR